MKPCAYYSGNKCSQTMEEHVKSMLGSVDKVLSRYGNRIKATGLDPEKILKTAIVLHDLGKLTKVYHDNNTGLSRTPFYRHELVSAAASLQMLEESEEYSQDEARVVSLVILHHHEPMIFGMLNKVHQPALTPSIAYYQMKRLGSRLSWHPSKRSVEEFLKEFGKETGSLELPDLSPEKVSENLSRLISLARYHPLYREKYYRMTVPFVMPLVLCDYEGASERGGEKPFFSRYVDRMMEAAEHVKN